LEGAALAGPKFYFCLASATTFFKLDHLTCGLPSVATESEYLMRASRFFSAALSLGGVPDGSGLAVPALQSHRAVYDLTLDKASDRSGITGHHRTHGL